VNTKLTKTKCFIFFFGPDQKNQTTSVNTPSVIHFVFVPVLSQYSILLNIKNITNLIQGNKVDSLKQHIYIKMFACSCKNGCA